MTNQQAAAYFAKLPPEQPARIVIANGDTGTVEDELFISFDDYHVSQVNDDVKAAITGKAGVFIKY